MRRRPAAWLLALALALAVSCTRTNDTTEFSAEVEIHCCAPAATCTRSGPGVRYRALNTIA